MLSWYSGFDFAALAAGAIAARALTPNKSRRLNFAAADSNRCLSILFIVYLLPWFPIIRQIGEPDLPRRLAHDQPSCLGLRRKRLGEQAQVLRVADLGSPQLAGKAASPHAPLRTIRVDHLESRIVQIR